LENQLKNLLIEIHSLIKSGRLPEILIKNIQLVYSIPGIGEFTAITIMSEIADINDFVKPKHLVAYFGIDPSINQSGKFDSNRNKIELGEEPSMLSH
jgi:transposase